MNKPFAARIAGMNAMYKLPANEAPTIAMLATRSP